MGQHSEGGNKLMASPKIKNSVGDWKAGFKGIVKPTLYEVAIRGTGWGNAQRTMRDVEKWGDGTHLYRDSVIMCENASFPGAAIGTQPNRIYGPVREFAYERIYSGDIALTFRMDEQMQIRSLLSAWHELINDTNTGDFNYYDDYTADIYVYQYPVKQEGSTRKPIYGIHIEEAYPKSIGEVTLGYDQTNTYSKQTVDFAFRRWRQIPSSEL